MVKKNKILLITVVTLLLLLSAGGYYAWKIIQGKRLTWSEARRDDGSKCDGIDVSNHQGTIRWKEVAKMKNIQNHARPTYVEHRGRGCGNRAHSSFPARTQT